MARTIHVRTTSRHSGRVVSRRLDLVYAMAHLSLQTWALLGIVVVALVLRILPLGAFSTEYDEGVYWLSLRAMTDGHLLYASIYNAQAPFFFASLYPLFLLLGQTLVAARVAIALYSLVGIATTYIIGNAVGSRYVGLAAAALVAVDPLYLVQSRTLEAEMPSLALMLLGIALALEAGRRRDARRDSQVTWLIVASGAFLGLALMVKLLAVVGLVPAALALAWPAQLLQSRADARIAHSSHIGDGPLVQPLWTELREAAPSLGRLLAGFFGACLIVLVPLLANLGTVYRQVVGVYLDASRLFGSPLQNNLHTLASLRGEWPLGLAAGFALALALWRRSPIVLLVTAWALATFAALLQQPTPWSHHFVFLVPPLALLVALFVRFAPSLSRPARWQRTTGRLPLAPLQSALITYGAVVVLSAAFLIGATLSALEDQRAIIYPAADEVVIVNALRTRSVPSQPVVTDDPYLVGLAGRSVPPQLIDTSLVRIQTGNLTAKQIEAIVSAQGVNAILFASGRLDQVPGLRAWVRRNYAVGQDFGDGRVLYLKQRAGEVVT
ncbi:MAG TPA: phospholipid carrier-dependent glycosyltransferase [Ktedonobacterales bacterium]